MLILCIQYTTFLSYYPSKHNFLTFQIYYYKNQVLQLSVTHFHETYMAKMLIKFQKWGVPLKILGHPISIIPSYIIKSLSTKIVLNGLGTFYFASKQSD